jgi:hypothetical protein
MELGSFARAGAWGLGLGAAAPRLRSAPRRCSGHAPVFAPPLCSRPAFAPPLEQLVGLRQWAITLLLRSLDEIGPVPFLVRVQATDTTRARFSSFLLEASGPLFHADYLVGGPLRCSLQAKPALLSAALHWFFLAAPTAPLVLFALLVGCSRADAFDAQLDGDDDGDGTACAISAAQVLLLGLALSTQAMGMLYAVAW